MKKIEAYTMATRKPCETALKQQEHKAFACDFKRADRTNTDTLCLLYTSDAADD